MSNRDLGIVIAMLALIIFATSLTWSLAIIGAFGGDSGG